MNPNKLKENVVPRAFDIIMGCKSWDEIPEETKRFITSMLQVTQPSLEEINQICGAYLRLRKEDLGAWLSADPKRVIIFFSHNISAVALSSIQCPLQHGFDHAITDEVCLQNYDYISEAFQALQQRLEKALKNAVNPQRVERLKKRQVEVQDLAKKTAQRVIRLRAAKTLAK